MNFKKINEPDKVISDDLFNAIRNALLNKCIYLWIIHISLSMIKCMCGVVCVCVCLSDIVCMCVFIVIQWNQITIKAEILTILKSVRHIY